ncbi:N-acetylmuramoyl-L-alanine amidase [Candidatus Venteria ishoeyi]|uniref:N-acetylmuramoyl-L-alanine amidase n=1 Tax=Candidatus Venteria ishoeyi TaxID=1899563 RepID=UPI0025A4D735|nr:N-acetylmuramoyl-L-alanine amidase [Candidatus Venteria ishoeyi]MDM8546850.1 N-acetylmuramoyl-L-alanine amidase [Candidatus Venteria ishoeyi]
MKIVNHRLYHDDDTPYPYQETPNKSGEMIPRFLVMHYTAGSGAEQSVKWLLQRRARASAHIVLGRDGSITQLAPFNIASWHAGVSNWKGIKGLNQHSIGIELDNAGPLTRTAEGDWVAWFGDQYASEDVIEAIHKNRSTLQGWQLYTRIQLETALELSETLIREYNLEDIVGHEDIAPRRKTDPGPAFPMETFRSHLYGRPDMTNEEILYETTVNLNIRSGPGSTFPMLEGSPLPQGTRLDLLEQEGNWLQVDVLDEVNGMMDLEGWVHARYVRQIQR